MMSKHHGMIRHFESLLKRACDSKAPARRGGEGPASVFGRLFERQEEQPEADQLAALGNSMEDTLGDEGDAEDVPIGLVFFGQFIDHDLTLDVTTRLGRDSGELSKISNFRTPRLELDSVYLNGPEASPYLYEPGNFRLVRGTEGTDHDNPRDLQRNRHGTAIIGDPRNDENLFISQLHGWVSDFHNQMLQLVGGSDPNVEQFERARDLVREWYQAVIETEYLPSIVSADVLDPLLEGFRAGKLPGPIDWQSAPDMPIEFSAAAFRFGHSQVREDYRVNADASPMNLFEFPSFQPVDPAFNLDFSLFFDRGGAAFQKARKIDTVLTAGLLNLPAQVVPDTPNLATRNLLRGSRTFFLPSGESIARKYFGIDPIETHPKVLDAGLDETPLWFYVLAEAESNGGKLGTVGGTIVAGTLLNLLLRDRVSHASRNAGLSERRSESMQSPGLGAVSIEPRFRALAPTE